MVRVIGVMGPQDPVAWAIEAIKVALEEAAADRTILSDNPYYEGLFVCSVLVPTTDSTRGKEWRLKQIEIYAQSDEADRIHERILEVYPNMTVTVMTREKEDKKILWVKPRR